MSVTIEFSCVEDKGQTLSVVVQYNNGDYIIKAMHITCVVAARKYGQNYINKILEPLKV